jgi:hypothetical protein
MKTRLVLTTAVLFAASLALADATVEQKTQMHFGGVMGGIINVFGRSATHEGIVSTSYVHGDRRLTNSGSSGEIIDLREEKVYRLDFDRKTYTVKTFDELRKEFEDAKQRAERQSGEKAEKGQQGPEYEVDFDVNDTGKKAEISGYNTHQVIVTITIHEKNKKIEKSGGAVLTADMWIGPRLAALRELADFDRRYAEKLYGKSFGGADMQQMALLMAQTPTFAKAMKAFADKKSSFDGTPVRTTLTFETVAGTEQSQQQDNSGGSPLGGMLGKLKSRRSSSENAEANRSKLFDSTSDVLKATTSASAAEVAMPAGFKQR